MVLEVRTVYGRTYRYKGFSEIELLDILHRIINFEVKVWEIYG